MPTLVYKYALRPPIGWDLDCEIEMRRRNHLWNTLVEIFRYEREQYREILSSVSVVSDLEACLAAITEEKEVALAARKRERATAHAKAPTPTLDVQIKSLAEQQKAARATLKDARAAARAIKAPALKELADEHKGLVTRARQCSGLWWPNYNAVVADYDRARSAAIKAGVELKFRGWRGPGRLTVQWQKGEDKGNGLSVSEFMHGRNSVASIDGDALAWTIFTTPDIGRRIVRFPIILHRPLPDRARLKAATISRVRLGKRMQWSVSITLAIPTSAPQHPGMHAVGININWRTTALGLRVAGWVGSDGASGFLHLPPDLVARFVQLKELQSRTDEECGRLQVVVNGIKTETPEGMAWMVDRLRAAKHPSPDLCRRVIYAWREHQEWEPALLEDAEDVWRRLWRVSEWLANSRAKALARRLDIYRCFAADMARRYAMVVLDDTDLRKLALLEQPDGEETPLHQQARWQRQSASPHELRKWIELQATKQGARIEALAIRSTHTCHACGSKDVAEDPQAITLSCGTCGRVFDRDLNAARNLLAAGTASGPVLQDREDAESMPYIGRFHRIRDRSQLAAAGGEIQGSET